MARPVSRDLESQKAEANPGEMETSGFSEEVDLGAELLEAEMVYPEPQLPPKAEPTS